MTHLCPTFPLWWRTNLRPCPADRRLMHLEQSINHQYLGRSNASFNIFVEQCWTNLNCRPLLCLTGTRCEQSRRLFWRPWPLEGSWRASPPSRSGPSPCRSPASSFLPVFHHPWSHLPGWFLSLHLCPDIRICFHFMEKQEMLEIHANHHNLLWKFPRCKPDHALWGQPSDCRLQPPARPFRRSPPPFRELRSRLPLPWDDPAWPRRYIRRNKSKVK